jgi:hypothetical protein
MAKNRLGAAAWAKLIEEWKHSGLSVPEFCQQRGLSCGTMKGWIYKPGLRRAIENTQHVGRIPRREPTERPPASATPVEFVPVRLAETTAPQASETTNATAIEVILGAGRRVIVERGFDPETLRQVVAALESDSC